MSKTFEVGKTYTTRCLTDYETILSFNIEKRTAKTVTTKVWGELKTFKVKLSGDVEYIKPWGSYSMSPVLTARNPT